MMRDPFAPAVCLLAIVLTAGPALAVEGRVWGDPHLRTMDGKTYDFNASGEFIASRSPDGDFEVQLRLESPKGLDGALSMATAIAVQVDSTRASVALGREPMLFVDERPITLPSDGSLELADGGRIERTKKGYEIVWSDGSTLSIRARKRHMNAYLRPAESRRGELTGLLGNFNGRADDDVSAATLAQVQMDLTQAEPRIAELVRGVLDGAEQPWLLENETLFEYKPGQSTRTFRHRPTGRKITLATLSPTFRRRAEETCENAGVTDREIFDACVLDVGATRDESFAESAAEVQARGVPNWDESLSRGAGGGGS